MTERQYRQALANGRRRKLPSVGESPAIARLVARADKQGRRKEELDEAWRQVAEPDWLAETRVESVSGGELRIAVHGKALHYQLTRMAERLARAMATLEPSVRVLKFVRASRAKTKGE